MIFRIEDCRTNQVAAKLDALDHKLDLVLAKLAIVLDQGEAEMADLSAITAAVTANSSVVDSAVVLIQRIAADLAAAATDPVAVAALADQLNADAAELAAAVAQNTPAEPTP